MLVNGSSDIEKAYAINTVLNVEFFSKLDNSGTLNTTKYNTRRCDYITCSQRDKAVHIYKFIAIFKGELKPMHAVPYAIKHSLLASVVLDYPKVKNEEKIVANLRENYNKIIEFSKDKNNNELIINNCSLKYRKEYAKLLRHILISDKNIPSNIDYNSIQLIGNRTLTYSIKKKE